MDLSEIKNNEKFMAGLGTFVYGEDGERHEIEHDGVSICPGDNGMEYIADKIIKLIE